MVKIPMCKVHCGITSAGHSHSRILETGTEYKMVILDTKGISRYRVNKLKFLSGLKNFIFKKVTCHIFDTETNINYISVINKTLQTYLKLFNLWV